MDPSGQVSLKPTQKDMEWSIKNHVFDNYKTAKCYHDPSMPINGSIPVPPGCQTCYSLISDKVTMALQFLKFTVTEIFPG